MASEPGYPSQDPVYDEKIKKNAQNKAIHGRSSFSSLTILSRKGIDPRPGWKGWVNIFRIRMEKTVWSHSVVTAHLVSEEYSFAWDLRSYFRDTHCEEHGLSFKSKNDLAIELIKDYESPTDEQVYVLVDSWYTSKKLIDSCAAKGYHLIGGLRVNRKIYPLGIGIKISEFASDFMQKSDTRLVTRVIILINCTRMKVK